MLFTVFFRVFSRRFTPILPSLKAGEKDQKSAVLTQKSAVFAQKARIFRGFLVRIRGFIGNNRRIA
jgi:hypothetical protein